MILDVVEQILSAKRHRQRNFTSHNANLVNRDASNLSFTVITAFGASSRVAKSTIKVQSMFPGFARRLPVS